jgi:hypothetical protein
MENPLSDSRKNWRFPPDPGSGIQRPELRRNFLTAQTRRIVLDGLSEPQKVSKRGLDNGWPKAVY